MASNNHFYGADTTYLEYFCSTYSNVLPPSYREWCDVYLTKETSPSTFRNEETSLSSNHLENSATLENSPTTSSSSTSSNRSFRENSCQQFSQNKSELFLSASIFSLASHMF